MKIETKRRIGLAVAAGALAVTGAAGMAPVAQAATCGNYVAQYTLHGVEGTIRDGGGATIGYWHDNYVINTWGYGGRQEGVTYGNVYTADRQFVMSGNVVSAYMTYNGSFCA